MAGPPNYGMELPQMFFNEDEKTFQYDDSLPSLPIPPLKQTLLKYLDSVRPFVTDVEYRKTEQIVKDFEKVIGLQLHEKLMEKAKHSRNWLEYWWEKYAYLMTRSPHPPYLIMAGPGPYSPDKWPAKEGTQLERAGMLTWATVQFWQMLRKQKMRVDRGGGTMVFSMHQYRRTFNTCKTPGVDVDKLNYYFKPESEGSCPTHMIVLCRGHFFAVELCDANGDILTAPEIQWQFEIIDEETKSKPKGHSLGSLTALERADWAQLRQHLIDIDANNERHLLTVQSAIFIMALSDETPCTWTEVTNASLLGECGSRWFDKSISFVVFRNGMSGSSCDHSPAEAMALIASTFWNHCILEMNNYGWQGPKTIRKLSKPQLLTFTVDTVIVDGIERARRLYDENCANVDIEVRKFTDYGKDFMKKFNLHPDTYVQLSLQLAYYRLHGKPAPTYETATTRQFYHGRTETLRSCTNEALEWCRAMVDPKQFDSNRLRLLMAAFEKHNRLMTESMNNFGCDRHLLGLQLIAFESGMDIPELYGDAAYTKSGGGGNFILSTSCLGYTPVVGGVPPMCKDGYGCFYSITSDLITLFVVSWRNDVDTGSKLMWESIVRSLQDMKQLLETSATNKL